MSSMTTIRISRRTKEQLDGLKHHPKESYEEVIGRLAATGSGFEMLPKPEARDRQAGTGDTGTRRAGGRAAYGSRDDTPGSVRESAGGPADDPVESRLREIVARLERLEEEMHETIYPPESAIRPEFIRKIKKAQADIRKGKGKTYDSVEDFFREIEA